MTAARPLVACALHDGADIDACGCPALDSPGAIAYRGLLVKARAEIARLTAELAAARAVPADVEAALDTWAQSEIFAAESEYEPRDSARADANRDILRATIARAISEATATTSTVGGLLATAPVDLSGPAGSRWTNAIEWVDGETWFRIATGASADGSPTLVLSTWCDGGWGYEDENPMSIDACVYALPARLVPAAEADVDPSQRGPLAATATNLHPDGCHTADPTAPRDCTSDGHHECTSCARFDAAGRAAMGDDPIGGPHGPLPKGG